MRNRNTSCQKTSKEMFNHSHITINTESKSKPDFFSPSKLAKVKMTKSQSPVLYSVWGGADTVLCKPF